MKRFSRKRFSQIMINKLLKLELDQLKKIISKDTNINYNLSYGDVIKFLLQHYMQSKKIEYTLEPKLNVSNPLRSVTSLNVSTKLDGKQRVSYTLN